MPDLSKKFNEGDSLVVDQERKQLLEDSFDIAPTGLTFCFDREQFLNVNFSADEFILESHSQGVQLDKLRDNLLQYSNILKSSLIELINQDYADFVSLSTNLVGLDKAIDLIESPLNDLRVSISSILQELDSTNQTLLEKLKALQGIRNKRDLVQSLYTLDDCICRLERWLNPNLLREVNCLSQLNLDSTGELDNKLAHLDEWPVELSADCSLHEDVGQRMDRIANEYTKLQFFAKKCRNHPILESMKSRIHWITSNLEKQLKSHLKANLDACGLTSIVDSDSEPPSCSKRAAEQLRQILSIYLSIDKLDELNVLYRMYALRPALSQAFVAKHDLVHGSVVPINAAKALQLIYDEAMKVLDFQIAVMNKHIFNNFLQSSDPLSEFDYLVQGFWPEAVDLICENLSNIFSAGNPDRFYVLYKTSMDFVSQVESKIESSKQLNALRSHPDYVMFMNKWSLPVYFQIRFQEIASQLENALQSHLVRSSENDGSVYHLSVSGILVRCLEKCWSDNIYMPKLKHRFWKLTLQLLTRWANFLHSKCHELCIKTDVGEDSMNKEKKLSTSSDQNLSMQESLIYLFIDAFHIVDYIRSELTPRIFDCLSEFQTCTLFAKNKPLLTECLEESCDQIVKSINQFVNVIVDSFETSCLANIRLVLDVPRQYRRTNRKYPDTESPYVSSILEQSKAFLQMLFSSSANVSNSQPFVRQLVQQCIKKLAQTYHIHLCEVLTAVKKMEDSLRKLREVRRNSTLNTQTQPSSNEAGLTTYTDDDKIRRQLYLDARAFSDQMQNLCALDSHCITELDQCIALTDISPPT